MALALPLLSSFLNSLMLQADTITDFCPVVLFTDSRGTDRNTGRLAADEGETGGTRGEF